MPNRKTNSASHLKLPSGPAARRRRASNKNEWTEADRAEHRRLLAIVAVVVIVLTAGVVLIMSGV
jgi:hypothetical protein